MEKLFFFFFLVCKWYVKEIESENKWVFINCSTVCVHRSFPYVCYMLFGWNVLTRVKNNIKKREQAYTPLLILHMRMADTLFMYKVQIVYL